MTPDASVVIPSIKEDVLTLESVPEDVPVSVEREGTLNEARNRGVRNANTDIVVILDDDIAFSEEVFNTLVESVEEDILLGVSDWEFGLVAGRVMIFYKSLWQDIGGFDERLRSHNGDTDFALKSHDAGYDMYRVPRTLFHHKEHERSITTWDRTWRLAFLCRKHPKYIHHLLGSTLIYNIGLSVGIDRSERIPKEIRP